MWAGPLRAGVDLAAVTHAVHVLGRDSCASLPTAPSLEMWPCCEPGCCENYALAPSVILTTTRTRAPRAPRHVLGLGRQRACSRLGKHSCPVRVTRAQAVPWAVGGLEAVTQHRSHPPRSRLPDSGEDSRQGNDGFAKRRAGFAERRLLSEVVQGRMVRLSGPWTTLEEGSSTACRDPAHSPAGTSL